MLVIPLKDQAAMACYQKGIDISVAAVLNILMNGGKRLRGEVDCFRLRYLPVGGVLGVSEWAS